MIHITLKYWGQIKQAAGVSSEMIELDDPVSIRSLLTALASRHGGDLARHLIDDKGEVHPSLLVVIGDDQVDAKSDRELEDGQTVTLLPPIAGGVPALRFVRRRSAHD